MYDLPSDDPSETVRQRAEQSAAELEALQPQLHARGIAPNEFSL